jgi:hypothetical protein
MLRGTVLTWDCALNADVDKDTVADVVRKSTVSEEDKVLHEQLKKLMISGTITSPRRMREIAYEQKKERKEAERKPWE